MPCLSALIYNLTEDYLYLDNENASRPAQATSEDDCPSIREPSRLSEVPSVQLLLFQEQTRQHQRFVQYKEVFGFDVLFGVEVYTLPIVTSSTRLLPEKHRGQFPPLLLMTDRLVVSRRMKVRQLRRLSMKPQSWWNWGCWKLKPSLLS